MAKQIQIEQQLFIDLYKLIVLDCCNADTYNNIKQQLENKFNKMLNHSLYSKYKTAPTTEEKEQARQDYLNRIGMSSSFRWADDNKHQ
jgi:hypothetical protein